MKDLVTTSRDHAKTTRLMTPVTYATVSLLLMTILPSASHAGTWIPVVLTPYKQYMKDTSLGYMTLDIGASIEITFVEPFSCRQGVTRWYTANYVNDVIDVLDGGCTSSRTARWIVPTWGGGAYTFRVINPAPGIKGDTPEELWQIEQVRTSVYKFLDRGTINMSAAYSLIAGTMTIKDPKGVVTATVPLTISQDYTAVGSARVTMTAPVSSYNLTCSLGADCAARVSLDITANSNYPNLQFTHNLSSPGNGCTGEIRNEVTSQLVEVDRYQYTGTNDYDIVVRKSGAGACTVLDNVTVTTP